VRVLCAGFLVLAAAGCSSPNQKQGAKSDSTAVAISSSASSSPAATTSAPKGSCPNTGLWAKCSIEKRLKRSGFVLTPIAGDGPKRTGFSVMPIAYKLGDGSPLELFIYKDEKALARDISGLDTVATAPKGKTNAWGGAPLFVRSANLIAVLVTGDAREAERLNLAITAGPPQPR
jgi:hypothetical protein